MRPTQLANQYGLAGSGGKEVEQPGLGLDPLAGFQVTTEGFGESPFLGRHAPQARAGHQGRGQSLGMTESTDRSNRSKR